MRMPGGCTREVLAGTDAKPKIRRLRGLEILAPLGLELGALLGVKRFASHSAAFSYS